jgi:HPt (histidine-containing phosphotransfer) domain-containing protein
MDVEMPVMGGFEATRLIRELEAGSGTRTPIVAVTTRAMKGDREACLEAGMDGFVPKPVQSAKLLEMLESLAAGSRPDSSASAQPVAIDRTRDLRSEEALDETALMILVGGSRELAGELAELFLDDLEPRVAAITAAVRDRDADRLRSAAHALRGSAGTLRAGIVSAAAGVLEAMGHSQKLDGVQSALKELNIALASLRPRLVLLAGRA